MFHISLAHYGYYGKGNRPQPLASADSPYLDPDYPEYNKNTSPVLNQ